MICIEQMISVKKNGQIWCLFDWLFYELLPFWPTRWMIWIEQMISVKYDIYLTNFFTTDYYFDWQFVFNTNHVKNSSRKNPPWSKMFRSKYPAPINDIIYYYYYSGSWICRKGQTGFGRIRRWIHPSDHRADPGNGFGGELFFSGIFGQLSTSDF